MSTNNTKELETTDDKNYDHDEDDAEKESPLNELIGVWSGFLVTSIIMFMIFPDSWIKWIVIISVFTGVLKKTIPYVEQHRKSQSEQFEQSSSQSPSSTFESESNSKYCPQCGALLSPGLSQCSTCGYKL